MKILIFINGGESFAHEEAYKQWLASVYAGWQSNPWEAGEEKISWKKSLAQKFTEVGGLVFFPQMPNLNAKYEEWKIIFESFLKNIQTLYPIDYISLIGHSLGGCFLLKYFAEKGENFPYEKLESISLIAPCLEEGDFTRPENFNFMKNFENITLFHAEDDLIVPIEIGREIAEKIPNIHTHFFPSSRGYGHFYSKKNPIEMIPELEEVILENRKLAK